MSETAAKSPLAAEVGEEFARYFEHLAGRVERAVRSVPQDKLYVKPFTFGNSIGHLVLHLTGNLNHYIGAVIAGTGYVRDRPREFTEPSPPPPDVALQRFREAIALVVDTVRSLDDSGWCGPVQEQQPIYTRFGLVLVCAAHLNNHIGQMSYLVRALGHDTNEAPVW
ncbi:MAG TPA: DinB family protein [Gemmataceae bacterium]|jgi:uncharacterized damage-inducible protein DinB